jgi:hypothetical protein
VQTLRKIGEIRFALTGTPGGPAIVGQLTATGAAFSWDGTLLAVRTYTDAYPVARHGRRCRRRPARTALGGISEARPAGP